MGSNKEQSTDALKEYYKSERIPQLAEEIELLHNQKPQDYQASLANRVTEYNQAIDFVYALNNDYLFHPHYTLVHTGEEVVLQQYIPNNQQKKQKGMTQFDSGAAKGLTIPKVIKEASFQNQPDFDLSFLSKQLKDLDTSIQGEENPGFPSKLPDETIIYEAYTPGQDENEESSALVLYDHSSEDEDDEWYEETYTEFGLLSEDYQENEDIYVYYDENIEPGMFLLELKNGVTEDIDILYLPHVPMNFPLVVSLIHDYLEYGGEVSLTFSMKDKNNNLLTPIDPRDPDKPIDPNLN